MVTRGKSVTSISRTGDVDIRRQLGLRVKALRAEQGVTQEELAERTGMFRTYVSRVESGQANPTLLMLQAIAQALQTDVPGLFVPVIDPVPTRVKPGASSPSRGRVRK